MLARRLRRRPNIDPTLIQCIMFAGNAPECLYYLIYLPLKPQDIWTLIFYQLEIVSRYVYSQSSTFHVLLKQQQNGKTQLPYIETGLALLSVYKLKYPSL